MILVTGATGNVGRALLAELRVCGAGPVRGLTRDAARARFPADVEAVQADFTIADQILPAFDGVRSLFLLLGLGSALDAAQRAAAWP